MTLAFFRISRFDPAPEHVDTRTSLRRDRQNLVEFQTFFQREQVARAFVAAEAIDLGGDNSKSAASVAEPVDELFIARLRGDVRVDEADAEAECFAILEVRLDEGRPLRGDGLGNLRIAVTGQVGEDSSRALALIQQGKKLIARVRPGVDETLAALSPTSAFNKLDLPTLERPRKAISGTVGAGNCAAERAESRNCVV